MIRRAIQILPRVLPILTVVVLVSCNATRYVPQGKYLLAKNRVDLVEPKKATLRVSRGKLEDYIQQQPNKRLLGVNVGLGFYNITDTTKNDGWHRFWGTKVGTPPVIYDSALAEKSALEMDLYLVSNGFFNAKVTDSIATTKSRKATAIYTATPGEPYYIGEVRYNVDDRFLEQVIARDTAQSLIKTGRIFQMQTLEDERLRITDRLKNEGFWSFGLSAINYTADSTVGGNRVNVNVNIKRQVERIDDRGREVFTNYPIFRLSRIVVNSFYNATMTAADLNAMRDSVVYNGIVILYDKRLTIRPEILVNAIRLSPNEIYDLQSVTRTRDNLRTLGFSANVLFSADTLERGFEPVTVTLTDPGNSAKNVSTTERSLTCYVQCTPIVRQNFSADFEASTTADYFSTALTLGYQNRNIFRGAEVLSLNFRGAYEFMYTKGRKNSFEFGVSASIKAPRFWLPISADKESRFKDAASQITMSYSIQNRPNYRRSLISAVYGYSWTLKNNARFTINPADINVVSVPWVDPTFLSTIENPYLRNSYTSQLIAGLSASYYYTTMKGVEGEGITFRVNTDANGNLFRLISSIASTPTTQTEYIQSPEDEWPGREIQDSYYKIFGLRFAQYARMSFDVSGRSNVANGTQLAWRFLLAGGYAYGNSKTIPFERLLFAGGANSMRGWQVRTLGPGSVYLDNYGTYPNQLGDLHLEGNFEVRQRVFGDLTAALFFDAGNVWMNSVGELRKEARFNFNQFYKQIALNTGVGVRYNIAGMMILRLDWGWKLHNPNELEGHRWFTNLGIADTALHFAIGLPF